MTDQKPEHTLSTAPVDASLPSQISAGGDLTYGKTRDVSLQRNVWSSRIFNPFAIGIYNWSTSAPFAQNLSINPLNILNTDEYIPWFNWLVQYTHAYQIQFNLEIRIIAHSAHRGRLGVSITGQVPSNNHQAGFFLPVQMVDISGGAHSHIFEIPNMFTQNQKLNLYSFEGRYIATSSPSVQSRALHPLDTTFGTLRIAQVTPLQSSSMLPNNVDVIVILHPIPNSFKMFGSVRPSGITAVSSQNTQ